MNNDSIFLEKAKFEANTTFDEHCKQWEYLQKLSEPTIADIERWLVARNTFSLAQDKFENVVRQIAKSKPSN